MSSNLARLLPLSAHNALAVPPFAAGRPVRPQCAARSEPLALEIISTGGSGNLAEASQNDGVFMMSESQPTAQIRHGSALRVACVERVAYSWRK